MAIVDGQKQEAKRQKEGLIGVFRLHNGVMEQFQNQMENFEQEAANHLQQL